MKTIRRTVHILFDYLVEHAYHNVVVAWFTASIRYYLMGMGFEFGGNHEGKAAMERTMKAFCSEEELRNKRYVRRMKKKLLYYRYYYYISYSEYYVFRFSELTEKARRKYVGFFEKKALAGDVSPEIRSLFMNKYETFLRFQPFYKRMMIVVNSEENRSVACDFVHEYTRFIVKAIKESEGRGIYVIDRSEDSRTDSAIVDEIMSHAPCVVEEYIHQADELACFHPKSVNTVRVVSWHDEDGTQKMFSFLRVGCGGSKVDNAGAGGIAAEIDLQTGIVITCGCREDGTKYVMHPDTGAQIVGAHIPDWKELMSLVDRLAEVVPEQHYVGWDLAYSNKGWCMVEGNHAAMMTAIQMCRKDGIRDLIERTFLSAKTDKADILVGTAF